MKTASQMTIEELKNHKPEKADFSTIREMADKIAQTFQPEQIILFGSYAKGTATESSDVDFLVVMESNLPPPRRSVPIYRLLVDYLVPLDILVRTRAEMEKYAGLPYSLAGTARREGTILYER